MSGGIEYAVTMVTTVLAKGIGWIDRRSSPRGNSSGRRFGWDLEDCGAVMVWSIDHSNRAVGAARRIDRCSDESLEMT